MSDAPPMLGDIPQHSEMHIPTLSATNGNSGAPTANGNTSLGRAKVTVYNSEPTLSRPACSRDTWQNAQSRATDAQSAFDTVSNHPMTQNVKDTVSQGPVAQTLKDETAKTSSEFSNLADARTTPSTKAATGQPLTHYHSFFYNLLSWQNPRATALSFLATVLFIFGARYLPVLRWTFKALYFVLGASAAAELAGKTVFSQGLASSFRPRKYYTIPRETLEASLEDAEQFINFFVIEFQRVIFAENVLHTVAAFLAAFLSYWLIKFLPLWGLSLIGVSFLYLGPLIYINNKQTIDQQMTNASNIVNSQAHQVKDLAVHHTARATETAKQYTGEYTAKARDMIGGAARGRSNSPELSSKSVSNAPIKSEPGDAPKYSNSDFPHAPKQEPAAGVSSHQQQYENSAFGGQAQQQYGQAQQQYENSPSGGQAQPAI